MAIAPIDPTPAALLRLGLKHRAPLAKLVLAAVVLMAGYALIANWFTNPRDVIVAAVIMLVLVVLVGLLSALIGKATAKAVRSIALFLSWGFALLFILSLTTTVSSFFFAWPASFTQIFGIAGEAIREPEQARSMPAAQPDGSNPTRDPVASRSILSSANPVGVAIDRPPQFEEFEQMVEYRASNGGSCSERNVVRPFVYCAVAESEDGGAEIVSFKGPREIWGRNGSSSIEINSPRPGCATVTLRYSDYGRGPLGDCRGNGGIQVQYTLLVKRKLEG